MVKYYGGRVVGDSGETITPGESNEFGLCEVLFHPGIGSGEEVVMRVYPGTEIVLPSAELLGFSKSGKGYFVGWSTTKHGNSMYFELSSGNDGNGKFTWYNVANYEISQKITISATRTLYAVWFDPSLCTMFRGYNGNLGLGDRVMGVFSTTNTNYQTVSFGGVSKSGTRYMSNNSIAGTEFENVDKGTIKAIIWSPRGTDYYPAMVSHTFGHSGNEISGGIGCSSVIGETNAPYIGRRHVLDSMSFGGASLYSGFRICVYLNKFNTFSQTYSGYAPFGAYICIYTCKLPESVQLSSVKFNAWNNSSESTMRSYPAPYHTAVLLPSPSAYPRAGNTLAAWKTNYLGADLYRPTGTFVNVGDYTSWTAYYKTNNYLVVFDLNGGVLKENVTSGGESLAYSVATDKVLSLNSTDIYKRDGTDGYVLIGWQRTVNGVTDDALFPGNYPYYFYANHPSSGELTYVVMKAVWMKGAEVSKYQSKVVRRFPLYDASGSSSTQDVDVGYEFSVYSSHAYFLPRTDQSSYAEVTYDGRKFAFSNWKIDNSTLNTNIGNKYAASFTYTKSTDTVAVYSAKLYRYHLTLKNLVRDPNNSNDKVTIDSPKDGIEAEYYTFTNLPTPDRVGNYEFAGWSEGSSSNITVLQNTYTMYADGKSADYYQTLTAQWVDTLPAYRLRFAYPKCTDLIDGPSSRESGNEESGTSYTFSIPTAVPERQDDWIFLGWTEELTAYNGTQTLYHGTQTGSNVKNTITLTRSSEGPKVSKTLYAQWFRYKYELRYDMNGAIEEFSPVIEYSVLFGNRSVIITRDIPTSDVSVFDSWVGPADRENPDGRKYSSGDSIILSPSKVVANPSDLTQSVPYSELICTSIDADVWTHTPNNKNPTAVTLKVAWSATKAYLSFDLRGGIGEDFSTLEAEKTSQTQVEAEFTIPSAVPVRASYRFKGWSTSTTGAVITGNTIRVRFGAPMKLYAIWSYAPAGSTPVAPAYDEASGRPLTIGPITAAGFALGTVTSKRIAANVTLQKHEATYNKAEDIWEFPESSKGEFSVVTNSNFRTELYKRDIGTKSLAYLGQPVWYYVRREYRTDEVLLTLSITNAAEPNRFSSETPLEEYVLRVVFLADDGSEYNAYYSFNIAPAQITDQDARLDPPVCSLTKVTLVKVKDEVTGAIDEKYKEERIEIEGITRFSRSFDVSITEIPVLTRKVRDRYIMDLGNTETYTLSFTRANPMRIDDSSTNSKDWSNGRWIVMFRQFLDFWQNLSYEPVKNSHNEYQRSGGFRFIYAPSDTTLFPIIDKNVFVKGAIDFDYMVGAVKGSLTLVVANMNIKTAVSMPEMTKIHFCKDATSAAASQSSFSMSVFQNVPFVVPQFPTSFPEDCVYWVNSANERLMPGEVMNMKSFVSLYFYPVELELIGDPVFYDTPNNDGYDVDIPSNATLAKVIIVGGGGAGCNGKFDARFSWSTTWVDDDLINYRSGAGGGSGQTKYVSIFLESDATMRAIVGAGARANKDAYGGYSEVIYNAVQSIRAEGGQSASEAGEPTPGKTEYAGGTSFTDGGYIDLGSTNYYDNPGSTNTQSPRGVPGSGHKLGGGGGAAALEAGVNGALRTSCGGYWTGSGGTGDYHDAEYGGGGAGGGIHVSDEGPSTGNTHGKAGDGASGYVQVTFYR